MRVERRVVTGWGRYASTEVDALVPDSTDEMGGELPAADVIARGLGRSYGDAAQRTGGSVVDTTACSVIRWLDAEAGIVRVDAGASIGALIDRYAPKGWFVPVSPGTRHVTVGGAIAADIHGKNHHRDGSFGGHVQALRLRLADDSIVEVSPDDDPELFWATVGGMGLTGIIVSADVRLAGIPSTAVDVETRRFDDLDDLMAEMRRSDDAHEFSVAWVDLLAGGRSVLTQGSFADSQHPGGAAGRYARPPNRSVTLPPLPRPNLVRRPLMRVFNEAWFRRAPIGPARSVETITSFFHPLDAIADWNRLYGRKGFLQWQCVVPETSIDALEHLALELRHLPSFLTVLKRFGPGNDGPLSFPMAGWTLAVDLPASRSVLDALPALDAMVAEASGRIYLAKDARLDRETFEAMYPQLDRWRAVRARVDPDKRFASDLSVRLGL